MKHYTFYKYLESKQGLRQISTGAYVVFGVRKWVYWAEKKDTVLRHVTLCNLTEFKDVSE